MSWAKAVWRPVYLADALKHERRVALKVLKPEVAAVVGAERLAGGRLAWAMRPSSSRNL